MPVNFQQKQGGRRHRRDERGRFPPGVSGNPAGQPLGARNAATHLAEALLDGEAEAPMRKLVERGLDGDPVMLKLAVEREAVFADCARSPSICAGNHPLSMPSPAELLAYYCVGDGAKEAPA